MGLYLIQMYAEAEIDNQVYGDLDSLPLGYPE